MKFIDHFQGLLGKHKRHYGVGFGMDQRYHEIRETVLRRPTTMDRLHDSQVEYRI